ncbi:hypothetical protein NIES592_12295 [Fischerella major NIES-592]|uniref:Uncharacterized protein n=3 Tax=Hapalosiphonaceae TaxID=1892263 RepID=A0A1U7GZZ2_9CYAN|nr:MULTISPECIES: COP23 domain-containing protein [Fischerella]OKH14085.1 hypothetical protein NIES592_12295 [Fischerella major NIES-592]PMB39683.1 hypothetical protein CEN41_21140 [Fischerella thermalis CCMEE 5330]
MSNRLLSPMLTKVVRFCGIALLTTLTTTTIIHQPSYASSTTFFCAKSKGVPVTYAKTQNGRRIPMIRWVSSNYFPSDLTPLVRCQQVAYRFQKNYDNGSLKNIISGTLQNYPVVCVAVSRNDDCTSDTLLFTLKRGANARQAVESLLNRHALAAGKVQQQSGDNTQILVDFNIYLNSLPEEP